MNNDAATCPSVAQIQYLVPIELNPTSHCPGNIEAACKLANNLNTDVPCPDANSNTMVVAIANGDFHIVDRFRFLINNDFVWSFLIYISLLDSY